MKKNLLYLGLTGYLLFALCTRLQAQTDSLQAHRYVTRATMYGIGFTNVFDTYLSPQEYKGIDFRISRETIRMTKLFDGNVSVQNFFQADVGYTHNRADNNNVYDFLDSDGYVRLKADLSASSKELYEAYQIYCTENNLPALKPRSFSEALIACQSRYNLEYCNNVTNAAGRRVRGFLGIEVLVRNHISVFSGDSMRTYVPEDVPEEWRR